MNESNQQHSGFARMLTRASCAEAIPIGVELGTGQIDHQPSGVGLSLGLILPEHEQGDEQHFRCLRCGTRERYVEETFRPARLGAPFFLSVSIPTLLEHNPPASNRPQDLPHDGRRLLTFSDSRQGTARFAVKAQLDAERNHVRSVIYHSVIAARPSPNPQQIAQLENQIQGLTQALNVDPKNPVIQDLLDTTQQQLEALTGDGGVGQMSWRDMEQALLHDQDIRRRLPDYWRELSLGDIQRDDLPKFILFREFVRRPMRQNSLDTLGLIGLDYPKINALSDSARPALWRARENLWMTGRPFSS